MSISDKLDAVLDKVFELNDKKMLVTTGRFLARLTPTKVDDALVDGLDRTLDYLSSHREQISTFVETLEKCLSGKISYGADPNDVLIADLPMLRESIGDIPVDSMLNAALDAGSFA